MPMCIKLLIATEKSLWGCSAPSGLGPISPQLWLQCAGCSTSTPASGTSRDTLRLRRDGEYPAGAVGAPGPPRELGVGCSSGAGSLPQVGPKAGLHPSPLLSLCACGFFPGSGGCSMLHALGLVVVSDGVFSLCRLGPLYASARVLWLLLGLAVAGLLAHFLLPCRSPWMAALVWPLQHLGAW